MNFFLNYQFVKNYQQQRIQSIYIYIFFLGICLEQICLNYLFDHI